VWVSTVHAAVTTPLVTETDRLTGRLTTPSVCPGQRELVLFQREHTFEHLYLADVHGNEPTPVSSLPVPEEGGLSDALSVYDGQAHWMPVPGPGGKRWFVFSGGGRFNNRDVYVSFAGAGRAYRLTAHEARDVTPRFSPDGTAIVFVSTRTGAGDLYLVRNAIRVCSDILAGIEPVPDQGVVRLTQNPERDLYPDWDPTARFIAYSEFGRSDLETTTEPNMGIAVVDIQHIDAAPVRLTFDAVQESRPSWSPDGNRIAFYSSQRIEDSRVDIGVIEVVYDARANSPRLGRLVETGVGRRVAFDVLPREEEGPEWAPGTPEAHPRSLVYVRAARAGGDRIVVANVGEWEAGHPGFEKLIEPWGLEAPQSAGWETERSLVIAAQSGGRYGIYRIEMPPEDSPSEALASFPRAVVAGAELSEGRDKTWRWIVGGGVAAIALILLNDSDDETTGEIGSPPCPPGIDDC